MRYSIEPRDRIYVKGYGFLSFAKNMGKSLSNKYGQKLFNSAKKSTRDSIKTASEATGDLIGNKTDKITNASKKKCNNNNNYNNNNNNNNDNVELPPIKKDIYLQKKDSKLLMN